MPPHVLRVMHHLTHNEGDAPPRLIEDQRRRDARATAHAWRLRIDTAEKRAIDVECDSVLRIAGYDV